MKPLLALTFLLFASQAFAEPEETQAEKVVKDELLTPLAKKDGARSRFSRSRPPPRVRRLRIPDATPRTDANGQSFVAFSVDEKFGWVADKEDEWEKDAIEGCVYVDSKEVFVKSGKDYRPAALLLGKKTKAAEAHICHAGELAAK
jgi:hypothetical protein